MNSRVTSFCATIAAVVMLFAGIAFGQAKKGRTASQLWTGERDKHDGRDYRDESHCLTSPEIRGDKDAPISCYCQGRDLGSKVRVFHLPSFGKG